MRICTRCVLPEGFPGIRFDEAGVCQYCRQASVRPEQAKQQAVIQARFEERVEQVRQRPGYHAVMAWSGGKDSTYTLWLLKERYGLRLLAFTFDNGFVSPGAFKNMRTVAEVLGVDHLIVKPRFDLLRRLFVASIERGMYPPRALERASSICNTCMGMAKGIGLRLALEKEIPLLAYGWSPGQVPLAAAFFATNRRLLQATVEAARAPLAKVVGGEVDVYFPDERLLAAGREYPHNVSPLAFLGYDEETALHTIAALGWERPVDTDPNSTNCLLNSFANQVHLQQTGYHPYAMELAGLVRAGYLDRAEALARLEEEPPPDVLAAVQAKLCLPVENRMGWSR